MRSKLRHAPLVVLLLAAAAVGGCKKKEAAVTPPAETAVTPAAAPAVAAVRITDVKLGNALGTDKHVTESRDTFAPKDTVFASVATEGSGSATLAAHWTFQDGQTVHQDSRAISPTGAAVTEFSIQKPDGWPKGSYKVEITVDGQAPVVKEFRIQ